MGYFAAIRAGWWAGGWRRVDAVVSLGVHFLIMPAIAAYLVVAGGRELWDILRG